jgi:hypothetical protein
MSERVRVMADYYAPRPLWSDGPLDSDFVVSPGLMRRLIEWCDEYTSWLKAEPTEARRRGWNEEGRALASELQDELGPSFDVEYFDDALGAYTAP